jgi:hypothetical protein
MDGAVLLRMQGAAPNQDNAMDSSIRSGFDSFRESWERAYDDPAFIQFALAHLPSNLWEMSNPLDPTDAFSRNPDLYRPYVYDAVTALGISMCRAGSNSTYFEGSAIYEEFTMLAFEGASGNVTILPTGSRDNSTVTFVIETTKPVPNENGMITFETVPSHVFQDQMWQRTNIDEYYGGGQQSPPPSLPVVDFNYNYIGKTARIVGYFLMGLTMAMGVVSFVWLIIYRHNDIVVASHPFFLLLILVGTIAMGSSIVPLSMEEPTVKSMDGLDMACMSSIWLYIVGVNLVLAALMAKARSVYKVRLSCEY